jgi:beta-galactosidase/beta-glucuronidase
VFVNGKKAGFHRGGYLEFTLDITSLLSSGSNEL